MNNLVRVICCLSVLSLAACAEQPGKKKDDSKTESKSDIKSVDGKTEVKTETKTEVKTEKAPS